jgi:hypothetical protein
MILNISYKHYCKILPKVINEVKKSYYIEVITKSKNKMKTTWNIIHKEKGNLTNENNFKLLRINNHIVHNPASIANEFNDYFLNKVGNISYKRFNKKKMM